MPLVSQSLFLVLCSSLLQMYALDLINYDYLFLIVSNHILVLFEKWQDNDQNERPLLPRPHW